MIPSSRPAFVSLVRHLFVRPDLSGVTIRELDLPHGPTLTLVYIADLMAGGDLERMVLGPLSQGIPAMPPEALARSGRFPAPEVRLAANPAGLQDGLLAGLAALHVEGHPTVLLLGSGRASQPQDAFGPDATANLALLRRHLRTPALRVEMIPGPLGSHNAVVYLDDRADPAVVEAMRTWAGSISPQPDKQPWWRGLSEAMRLPKTTECTSPGAVADALRRGYVAVVADHMPGAQVGPLTLELLFTGCHDHTLLPAVRRLVFWPRLIAALSVLLLSAGLAAATAYHHALIPGPFLVAIAATRENSPLPIEGALVLLDVFGESARAGARMLCGRRCELIGVIAMLIAALAAFQSGIVGPVVVAVALISKLSLLLLPSPTLIVAVRTWRFCFLLAGFMLGLFGVALLLFVTFVYLAWERPFGHPLRRRAKVVTS